MNCDSGYSDLDMNEFGAVMLLIPIGMIFIMGLCFKSIFVMFLAIIAAIIILGMYFKGMYLESDDCGCGTCETLH